MEQADRPASGIIHALLTGMAAAEASDLHLIAGYRPTYRVHGELVPTDQSVADGAAVESMVRVVVPGPLRERLSTTTNLDFSLELESGGATHRYRCNVFRTHGEWGACFRHFPASIPTFEWMGFPIRVAEEIAGLINGLVIFTGITGSGKSTTLAGIVSLLNQRGGNRIITVEEPIEYVYPRVDRSIITQREVGIDCPTFFEGLKYGLRQDPDVILVGEIRDRDTAQMALSAAETGHLILTTLHTKDTKGAISRIVDLFGQEAQDDIRAQLSLCLRYVVAQRLLPNATPGRKRALALETMVVNTPIRAAIRLGKLESIDSAIQTGKADGMIRFDESLQSLLAEGRITYETARQHAKNPDSMLAVPHARR
jgi:twitching motility protein PilT